MNWDRQAAPVPTNVISMATSIDAGHRHSLAVKDERVYAWGNNDYGQTNVPILARSGVAAAAAGEVFSLALKTNGSVVAWGANLLTNVPPETLSGVTQVAAGGWHALALKNGGIVAWGSNDYGQLDVPVSLTSGVTAISAGGFYSLALKNGGVEVFGIPATNSLAYGIRDVPAAATSGVTAISAGRWHALALKDGGVIAWGATNFFDPTNYLPDTVTSGVAAVSAGDLVSMAIKTDGSLVVWGEDTTGQLPIPDYAATGIVQVAAGDGHCLIMGPVLPPRFMSENVPDAFVSNAYYGTVTATGMPAVTYHPKQPGFPSWMTLDSNTGELGGTPLAVDNGVEFSVIASNLYGMATNSYTLNVLEMPEGPPIFVTTSPLPDGEVGAPYTLQVVVSNSASFSIVGGVGSGLPDGLTMGTNGLIEGTPTAVYNSFFQVLATNAAGSSNRVYFMDVTLPTNPPVFYTTSPLPDGEVGVPYSVQIVVSNNPTFSLEAGSLPDGLYLSADGMVTGTPTQIESANFTVLATNSVGTSNRVYDLEVYGPPVFTTTSPLPDGSVGTSYAFQLAATGDPVFIHSAGSLPPGIGLTAAGMLTGTPTVVGPYNFTVDATNAYGWTNRAFDLTVNEPTEPPVFVTVSPLPDGVVGQAYSVQIEASNSPVFSLAGGSLPAGLYLNAAGMVTGTPTQIESANFTVMATNVVGSSNRVYDLDIDGPPVFVTTNPLPGGVLGVPYSQQIEAQGDPDFSVVAGSLPGGLSLGLTGLLDGTPTNEGSFNFTVQVTNAYGWSNRVFDLEVVDFDPPTILDAGTMVGGFRITWTNPNPSGQVQVWTSTNITTEPVPWSNQGVQISPWTNPTPNSPSYYQLRMTP